MWKGLFEWSMNYQDGTNEGARPRELTEEDRHWLENALKTAMVDLGNRMKDIKESLDASGSETQPSDEIPGSRLSTPSLQEKEQLLDELLDLVESIDQAKDLSTIGGLQTLLTLLQGGTSPSLQWRAAEIIATCVQNNPSVQEIFLRDGCMSAIWPLLDHDNVTCQIKALLAMSCMIRGCPAALQWFREQRGISKTVDLLSNTEDIRIQRKCLHILEYALRAVPADCMNAVSDRSPLLSALTSLILRRDDADVRTAALAVGKQLAEDKYALKLMKQVRVNFVDGPDHVDGLLSTGPGSGSDPKSPNLQI